MKFLFLSFLARVFYCLMASVMYNIIALWCLTTSLVLGITFAQLSPNYYKKTCPQALTIIKNTVTNAVAKEHRMGASLLRLHFHDCFVNACSLSLSLSLSTYYYLCFALHLLLVESLSLLYYRTF